jgi:hypothetical protein
MHRVAVIAFTFALASCDANVEKVFDVMTGRESNLVVLLDRSVQLRSEATALSSDKELMKILGEWSSVCLSLRSNVPLQDAKMMDQIFAEAMGNAKVKVELTLSSGAVVTLSQPLQAWSMTGKIAGRNELSACASAPCKAKLPVGTQVSKIDITTDVPLTVQGIYWTSEKDLSKPPATKSQATSASSPTSRSACTA